MTSQLSNCDNCPDTDKRAMAYLFAENHGGDPQTYYDILISKETIPKAVGQASDNLLNFFTFGRGSQASGLLRAIGGRTLAKIKGKWVFFKLFKKTPKTDFSKTSTVRGEIFDPKLPQQPKERWWMPLLRFINPGQPGSH